MKKNTLLFRSMAVAIVLAFTSSGIYAQSNVAINSSGVLGNTSAVLDLNTGNSGTQGFLAPTVALTSVNTLAPIVGSGANGLMVYTTASPTGGNGPGFYYWNGTQWQSIASVSSSLSGSGTANYLTRWITATALGSGLVQDNNIAVGINNVPVTGTMLTVTGGTANNGISTTTAQDTDDAVIAINTASSGTGYGYGVFGATNQSGGFGVYGINRYAGYGAGVGVMGVGSGGAGSYFPIGEGIMGDGSVYGVVGLSDTTTGQSAGGYFVSGAGSFCYVGASLGSTYYKVNGNGSVATIVKNTDNKSVNLICPEAPEILFEDYGQGTLASGKTHIDLDPTYSKNVTINQKHPLRVIITMNDPCPNTIYVTNRTATGFDVIENNNGTSNASFTYEVIANRADETNPNGTQVKYADIRFPDAPAPMPLKKNTGKTNTTQSTTIGN